MSRKLFEQGAITTIADTFRFAIGKVGQYTQNIEFSALKNLLNSSLNFLSSTGNLSDLTDKAAARANLSVNEKSSVYLKTETYGVADVYPKAQTYTQSEVDLLLSGKVEKYLHDYTYYTDGITGIALSRCILNGVCFMHGSAAPRPGETTVSLLGFLNDESRPKTTCYFSATYFDDIVLSEGAAVVLNSNGNIFVRRGRPDATVYFSCVYRVL